MEQRYETIAEDVLFALLLAAAFAAVMACVASGLHVLGTTGAWYAAIPLGALHDPIDMGAGQFTLMKDLSAPILVAGSHWGGLRMAYTF